MPKIKTHKATSKRIRKSGKKKGPRKIIRRKSGQDHFNSRETGTVRGRKRRDVKMPKGYSKTINAVTPYM